MKFKFDENLGSQGKALLQADGHDVMTVAEQQMSGAQDERVYGVCRDEGRVIVTLDHDFGQTLRFPPEATAGIVVLECKGRVTPTMILARLTESSHCCKRARSTTNCGSSSPAVSASTNASRLRGKGVRATVAEMALDELGLGVRTRR